MPNHTALICRWGAVCIVKNGGLEERFCSLLNSRAARQKPPRYVPWLTAAVTFASVVSLNAFQLRAVSAAHARAATAESTITRNETHRVVPNGDYAVLPEGVTVHAIGASEVSAKGDSDTRSSERVWWHPDGTLYSFQPAIGDHQSVKDGMADRAPGLRRLRFAVRVDNLPNGQDTTLGSVSTNRLAGICLATTTRIPGGRVWLFYGSVPNVVREESLSVAVSHGPWKEIQRRPLAWSLPSPLRSWDELRLQSNSPSPAAPRAYPVTPTQSGTFEFAVTLAGRYSTYGNGDDWRFFLLDKDGHRLASQNPEKTWRKDGIVAKFSADEKTARRAAFVGVESRPFTYVTFNHFAVRPKSR